MVSTRETIAWHVGSHCFHVYTGWAASLVGNRTVEEFTMRVMATGLVACDFMLACCWWACDMCEWWPLASFWKRDNLGRRVPQQCLAQTNAIKTASVGHAWCPTSHTIIAGLASCRISTSFWVRLRLQGVSWSTSLAHLRHELQRGSVVWTQHRLKKRIRLREGGGADAGKETRQWIWRSWPGWLCNMEVAKGLVPRRPQARCWWRPQAWCPW